MLIVRGVLTGVAVGGNVAQGVTRLKADKL